MSKTTQPGMSVGRRIYNFLFWVIVYLVGLVIGSTVAWALGADLNNQIGGGFLGGFILLFLASRWVRRVKSR